jgi:hypothetical protein
MEEASETRAVEGAGVEPKGTEATATEKKGFKVVIAIDDSDISYYALSWTIDFVISNRGDDCQLVVLHAQHSVDPFMYPVAGHGLCSYRLPSLFYFL